jgi:hypothetical protein
MVLSLSLNEKQPVLTWRSALPWVQSVDPGRSRVSSAAPSGIELRRSLHRFDPGCLRKYAAAAAATANGGG